MMLEETINRFLRDVVARIMNDPTVTVIKGRQNGPRPDGSYVSVRHSRTLSVGLEYFEYEDNSLDPDLTETVHATREHTFSLDFYRDGANDMAERVALGLAKNSISELFRSASLGYGSRSPLRDLSERLESEWEERSQFDLVLNSVGSTTDIVRAIEHVNICGIFEFRGTANIQSITV